MIHTTEVGLEQIAKLLCEDELLVLRRTQKIPTRVSARSKSTMVGTGLSGTTGNDHFIGTEPLKFAECSGPVGCDTFVPDKMLQAQMD